MVIEIGTKIWSYLASRQKIMQKRKKKTKNKKQNKGK